jgi:hypothetical protein
MDKERPSKLSPVCIIVIAVLLAVVPLYVLSIGPAIYLVNHGFDALQQPLEVLYAPLVWAAKHCDPLDYSLKRHIAD